MPRYRLTHRHSPDECGAAIVSWRGFSSALSGRPALSSCQYGGHHVWWDAEATDREAALALLPAFVAQRTEVARVTDVDIP